MLWVSGHYNLFNSFWAGTVFIRQNLTSIDVRFWRMKTVPALKGLLSYFGKPVDQPLLARKYGMAQYKHGSSAAMCNFAFLLNTRNMIISLSKLRPVLNRVAGWKV